MTKYWWCFSFCIKAYAKSINVGHYVDHFFMHVFFVDVWDINRADFFVPAHAIHFFYEVNGKIVPVISAPKLCLCGWQRRAFAHLFLVYCSSQDERRVASKSTVFGLTWTNSYQSKWPNMGSSSTALLWNNTSLFWAIFVWNWKWFQSGSQKLFFCFEIGWFNI